MSDKKGTEYTQLESSWAPADGYAETLKQAYDVMSAKPNERSAAAEEMRRSMQRDQISMYRDTGSFAPVGIASPHAMVEEMFIDRSAGFAKDAATRKGQPIMRGFLDYFPLAALEIAHVSHVANEQHNPGQQMHWARGKSTDHADCLVRHLLERGTLDTDGLRHTAKAAWRAMALLQEELEKAGGK